MADPDLARDLLDRALTIQEGGHAALGKVAGAVSNLAHEVRESRIEAERLRERDEEVRETLADAVPLIRELGRLRTDEERAAVAAEVASAHARGIEEGRRQVLASGDWRGAVARAAAGVVSDPKVHTGLVGLIIAVLVVGCALAYQAAGIPVPTVAP